MEEWLDLEFCDLPGLNSDHDASNLAVIQRYLANSFLLLVFDYAETNGDKRKTLLQEIKNTVDAMGGNKKALDEQTKYHLVKFFEDCSNFISIIKRDKSCDDAT